MADAPSERLKARAISAGEVDLVQAQKSLLHPGESEVGIDLLTGKHGIDKAHILIGCGITKVLLFERPPDLKGAP